MKEGEGELREQLDHIRTLRRSRGESTWLRGNTFYGKRQMFRPDFLEWFEGLQLPPYHLEKRDGQYELTFEGKWPEVMLWEIPALAVLMELRSRAVLRDMGRFELQGLYARAMTKLWGKGERLGSIAGLKTAGFGPRRRHSVLWQGRCAPARPGWAGGPTGGGGTPSGGGPAGSAGGGASRYRPASSGFPPTARRSVGRRPPRTGWRRSHQAV